MTTHTSATRQTTHAMLRDAARLDEFLTAAVRNMDEGLGGYPSSPNTGTPSPMMDSDGKFTTTERAALGPTDRARADLELMMESIRKAAPHLQTAAAIAQRWALLQVSGETVQARIASITASIWCKNCLRHGHEEPRSDGLDECTLCSIIRGKLGRPAPSELVETMRRQRNLNRLEHEVEQWKRSNERGKKARQRAANVSPRKSPA